MLPDDWMRINTIASVQSLPMVAPVKGRWKCSFDYYYNPWSNIYGFMDNNMKMTTDAIINNNRFIKVIGKNVTGVSFLEASAGSKVPCAGVLDFLGYPIGYFGKVTLSTTTTGKFTVSPTNHPAENLITYFDIVRNYYVNNQDTVVKYIRQVGGGLYLDRYGYADFELSKMDEAMADLRYRSRNGMPSAIALNQVNYISNWQSCLTGNAESGSYEGNQFDVKQMSGLFLRTYRMDLLRGIMNASVGELVGKVQVVDGYVNMQDVYFANKLQTLINRIDITGGRFSDWIRTRWNIDPGIDVDRPIYLGSHSLWLNTIDVIATASGATDVGSRNDNSVLGQQVGYQVGKMTVGKGRDRQRPITVKSKQYGTLMCIFSIVPDVVYSQGFELSMLKTKFADIYDPAFKQLGYQDVLKGEYRALPSFTVLTEASGTIPVSLVFESNDLKEKVGKRVAWSEYMASLNRSHSDFAFGQSLDFWVNNRTFSNKTAGASDLVDDTSSTSLVADWKAAESFRALLVNHDFTSYIYPHLWNHPFADTRGEARNYVVDVFFAIDANRSLGKRLMPHL